MAKTFVGKRSSSVFHAPPREVLEATTYREANRLSKDLFGRGISAQAYALRAKILEVDPVASADLRLVEVHPEVSFCAMKGRSLAFSKKSWNGQMERRDLIRSQGIDLPDRLENAGIVAADDLLDAAAAAWSAWRIHLGLAETLPPPETDGWSGRHSSIQY
jgi:predicted RNase H-like nuclease